MNEQLIVSALVTGEVSRVDRAALERKLQAGIQQVLEEFRLSLKENKVVVEDDLLGIEVPAPGDQQHEVPMSFDGSIPPD